MTTRPIPRLAIAAAAIAPGLALSACASSLPTQSATTATTAAPSASRSAVAATFALSQLTGAQLKSRLLTASDLPPGYGPYAVSSDAPESSDKPSCLTTLNRLSDFSSPSSPATQANAAFAASQAGPWVIEVVRSYPGDGATQAFTAAKTVLSGCQAFSLAWTSPPQTATESVVPTAAPALGNQAWAASVDVQGGTPTTEDLILVQAGSSLLALQVASAVGLPSAAQVTAIADTAVARLASLWPRTSRQDGRLGTPSALGCFARSGSSCSCSASVSRNS